MGIIKRGILGGFSNKVANVVGSSWKGRAVIKSLPLSVANPRTTPQVNQRNKFGSASYLYSTILGTWVKPLWDRFSGNISGYNAIVKQNVETFDNSGAGIGQNMLMAKGKMESTTTTSVVADASLGTVVVNGTVPNDVTWGQAGEELYVMAFNNTTQSFSEVNLSNVDPGDSFSVTLNVENYSAGNTGCSFCALRRADGTQVSYSESFNFTVIA